MGATFNKEGKKACLFGTNVQMTHNWEWFERRKEYRCTNGNCKGVKKDKPPTNEGVINLSIKDRMFGRSHGTIKGGKWGNKADKEASKNLHRKNPGDK